MLVNVVTELEPLTAIYLSYLSTYICAMSLDEGDGVQPRTDAKEHQGLSQGRSFTLRAPQGPWARLFWKSKLDI